jgi:hypothetical protein
MTLTAAFNRESAGAAIPCGESPSAGAAVTLDAMTTTTTDLDPRLIAERFVALWNEPDTERRGAAIAELWTADARHVLVNAPEGARIAAADLAIPVPPLECVGHDALERRVARAYEMFIAAGDYRFRAGEVTSIGPRLVSLAWEMVSTATDEVVGGGVDVLAFDPAGRIRTDHQFVPID